MHAVGQIDDEQVLRLDVAVDDVERVQVVERRRQVQRHAARLRLAELAGGRDRVEQVAALIPHSIQAPISLNQVQFSVIM